MAAPSKRHVPLFLGYNKSRALLRGLDRKVELNLTSMIDMFTILVVFLLKSYSAEGAIVTVSQALALPHSHAEQRIEMRLQIDVNNSVIVVDGDPVVQVDEDLLSTGNSIPLLTARLRDHLEYTARLKGTLGEEDRVVNIQGDEAIPAILLQRVMASCSEAGYETQNIAVIKIEGEEQE
ncbi:biopolymer transporter ExbD [Candidatus Fermentibacterales bacterium]|nr:biopolymer transporter ExbD [Candidatus Fermentibacterales bacterium]